MIAPFALPPLNSMRTAPDDGGTLLAMTASGRIISITWSREEGGWVEVDAPWWGRFRRPPRLLGWWPFPDVRTVFPEQPLMPAYNPIRPSYMAVP